MLSDEQSPQSGLRAQPARLYGRRSGHPLRPRQRKLMDHALPRYRLHTPQEAVEAVKANPERRVFLEIGFGSGEHARGQSALNPDALYIASETFENGICALLGALCPEGREEDAEPPANFRLWPEDARELLDALPDKCLDRAYLMFPDPWPKKRHDKRRFVHPDNIARLKRLLKPEGEWRVASDHPVYQEWVEEVMKRQDSFKYAEPALERPEDWSPTRYEQKALREGRTPFYWTFKSNGQDLKNGIAA